MNDIAPSSRRGVIPPSAPELDRHYAEVKDEYRAGTRMRAAAWWTGWVTAGGLLITTACLGGAILKMLPLEKKIPVVITLRADGTPDTEHSVATLPSSRLQDVIKSAIWFYVKNREGYAYGWAQNSFDVVSHMSAPTVDAEYRRWFLPPSKESPQATVGKAGQINITSLGSPMCDERACWMRFTKTIERYTPTGSSTIETKTWTANAAFQIADMLSADGRLINPHGIMITQYQATEDTP